MHVKRTIRCRPKPGYTLVEMLVVILIIAIIMAIVVPLGASVLGVSREAATKTTVKKLGELMQKRLDGFNRDYAATFRRRTGYDWEPANPQHVLDRKTLFNTVFLVPQARSGMTAADNAEVLYELLTQVEGIGSYAGDDKNFGTGEVGDTDNDGRPEFLDGWGQPIVYYPVPTRLIKPNGHTTGASPNGVDRTQGARILFGSGLQPDSELNRDQDDQFGVLFDAVDADQNGSLSATEITNFENSYHTYQTYHTPLIISPGADGVLGLHLPHDTTNHGHLAKRDSSIGIDAMEDNITNYNTRTGAD